MFIQVLSDLHLEMFDCNIPVSGDVIVLAGDIHVGTAGIRWAKKHFKDTPVVYVAGNHEFYHQTFPDLVNELRDEAAASNVAFLENDVFEHGGIRFLGATLWTDFTLNGFAQQLTNMAAARHGINDFHLIKTASGTKLHPNDAANTFKQTCDWLKEQLATPYSGPTVVVTHHAPCIMSTHPWHRFGSLASAFVNNMENLILDFQHAAWISGHTHYCADYHIGETRLVSNQRGYGDNDVEGFLADYVIDLS